MFILSLVGNYMIITCPPTCGLFQAMHIMVHFCDTYGVEVEINVQACPSSTRLLLFSSLYSNAFPTIPVASRVTPHSTNHSFLASTWYDNICTEPSYYAPRSNTRSGGASDAVSRLQWYTVVAVTTPMVRASIQCQ